VRSTFTRRRSHEQGVLHLAGRVVGRDVERVEVVPLGLDLGPLGDLVPHRDEHVRQLVGDHRDRVPGAGRGPVGRQGDVDPLGDQDLLVALALELRLALLDRGGDAADGGADPAARVGPGLRRQRADLGPGQGQRRLVARVREARLLELVQVLGRVDGGQRLDDRVLDLIRCQRGHLNRVVVLIWCGHHSLPHGFWRLEGLRWSRD
jgi:hypothetical protein